MQGGTNSLFFCPFETNKVFNQESLAYINPPPQEGTVSLVKIMNGKYIHTFRNLHYPVWSDEDTGGAWVMIDRQYKWGVETKDGIPLDIELFDLDEDLAEKNNMASLHPDIVEKMQGQLLKWQPSVLLSLTVLTHLVDR